ncbi:MAG: DUF3570 domain-containing protein, partial [Nannocystaceae bacterium]
MKTVLTLAVVHIALFTQAVQKKATPPIGGQTHASLYVRSDTDKTTVISPRVRHRQQLGSPKRNLDITYSLDAWTSASIDIRTAATPTVSELRHEVDAGYSHEIGLGAVHVGYRVSYEPDYLSNSVRISGQREFLQRTITLQARLFGALDRVGRAGDSYFRESVLSAGALLSSGFVLSRSTLAVVAYELRGISGYQASPYRYVALGGAGGCSIEAIFCVPEEVPRKRLRNAFVGQLRQALGRYVAVGGLYRFYIDSWLLYSHTGAVDLALTPIKSLQLGLEYRLYAQSGAEFYRASYIPFAGDRFVTRDRELSSLGNHRLALSGRYRHPLRRGSL